MNNRFVCCYLASTNSISLSGRYLEFRIFVDVVMVSNFEISLQLNTSHWIMFFQKGYIQENPGNAILLGLNRGVGCTMTQKGCSVFLNMLVYS